MIDEIIEGVIDWAESGRTNLGRPPTTRTPKQALTAIYEKGLECIGADIVPVQGKSYVDQYYFENKLKASQRKAWAKACGVKG